MGDEADRVIINVGGIAYETYISTLQNIPDTRLAWLAESLDPDPTNRKEIFFDRHSGVFVHILNYYRTGKLHTPIDICGPLFEEELNFWGIDEKQMEPCCWESFTKHREAEVNLKSFEGPGFEDLKSLKNKKFSSFGSQDGMTCRERMDQIWYIMDRPHSSNIAKYTSILSCFMIVLSVTVYCLNTLSSLENGAAWIKARDAIDVSCMCWFTIEFVVRVLVCPDRREFAKSISNWIDFISVLPSYLKLLSIRNHSILTNLIIIRLLRLFRFFKLSYGLQVLLHTLKASFYELILLLLILLIPIVIFSSLVHTIEKGLSKGSPTKFDSIPATFWWCLITMTSVGYGDMVPETWAGKIIGSMCAICGVLIVALPISVIGSNFSLYYAHVRARLKLPSKDRKILAGNIRGLLKQPLSLSSRERDRRVLKRSNVSALKRKGAARSRITGDTSILRSTSVTSDEEFTSGSPVNRVSTSENCLDWDSTAESSMKFIHHRPHRRKKRESIDCTEHAIDLLDSGSDSCKEVDENVNVGKKRRGGQILYQNLLSDNVKENLSPCRSTKGTNSVEEHVSSNEFENERLADGLSVSSDKIRISPEASLDLNINYSPYRHPMTFSSRRTSMKLMELETLPRNSEENLVTRPGFAHAKSGIKDDQSNKDEKSYDISLKELSTSDLNPESKFRTSRRTPEVGMANHNIGYYENNHNLLTQKCDKSYNVSDKAIPHQYPMENGDSRCHIRNELMNARNSRSDSNLLPAIQPASLPLFISENDMNIDGNRHTAQTYEDTKFGCK